MDNPAVINREFLRGMGEHVEYVDEAVETLEALQQRVAFYIVSNGTAVVQKNRVRNSKFRGLIRGIFVSDTIGCEKPEPDFFNKTEILIGNPKPSLLIGDSLIADIAGGKKMGYQTCWLNRTGEENATRIQPDYEVRSWREIRELLMELTEQEEEH